MPADIKIGPPGLTLHQGYTVVTVDRDGMIPPNTDRGIYFLDTRLVSAWNMLANDVPWTLLTSGPLGAAAAQIDFTNAEIPSGEHAIPEKALGLVLGRHLDGGMHEDVDITNYGAETARFVLTIEIGGDFADLFEVKAKKVPPRTVATEWNSERQTLTVRYRNKDFSRAFRVAARDADSRLEYADGKLRFSVEIEPNATWHGCLIHDFANGDDWTAAPHMCVHHYETTAAAKNVKHWLDNVAKVDSSNAAFDKSFSQSLQDMAALRLPIEGTDNIRFVPAAGLPWFVALFGRDSLIVSLQAAIVHPEFACGALRVLAKWQAAERDDYRDATPGKIQHELRRGELAHFHQIPHTPYYGTADATPLYLATLHSAWICTGKREILSEYLQTAERCLTWIDRYGDLDGDGFQEYETRSSAGYENQGWKDSGEAVLYADGSDVKAPKGLCELQGYVYDAWLRMAQIYDALAQPSRAAELRAKAKALFDKFNATFWDEEEGSYIFALDGDKNPAKSVTSNAGQCLWSGIVPRDRAKRVIDRLMQPDMFSGWGIRTLSTNHPAFNPYHYQIGSVWPHDNGLIAQGMKRYGFHERALTIAGAIVTASGLFERNRLPELYAGLQRTPGSFPVQYLGANVPQGWAAGSMFSVLQILLGFQPDAPSDMLYLDPRLPEWMPQLTVRDIRIGKRAFEIRLTRCGAEETEFEVISGPKDRVARRPMTEWSAILTGLSA